MDSVDIFLLYVVGFCVILFFIVDSYEDSRKRRRKADVDGSEETLVNGCRDEGSKRKTMMDDDDDDDWEGIERTELEKMFGEAVVFVNINGEIDEDLKLKLYGLQMLALQGPCHESQPMFFNVSARSKWNAWQKMGEMSREMAMEKYINTLVDAIPEWRQGHSSS